MKYSFSSFLAKASATAFLFLCTLPTAYAGVIVDSGPGGDVTTPDPNNAPFGGDFGTNPNNFGIAAPYQTILDIDVPMFVQDSGGVTEYEIRIAAGNFTGRVWSDFDIALGFGIGSNFVYSQRTEDPNDLSFGSTFGSQTFSGVETSNIRDMLIFYDGSVQPIEPGSPGPRPIVAVFGVRVPDSSSAFIPDLAKENNGYHFTLRLTPSVVPEPTTLALLAMSLFVALGQRSRKRI